MADSLINGHASPRKGASASCSSYCSLGTRWKEAQPDAGLPTKLYCNRKGKMMEKGRTLAFQVSEELFQKVKEYLA